MRAGGIGEEDMVRAKAKVIGDSKLPHAGSVASTDSICRFSSRCFNTK